MCKSEEQQLLIRFRGICAHLNRNPKKGDGDGDDSDGPRLKRTVLIKHRNGNSGIEHHIPYIECYADDLKTVPKEIKVVQYTRPGSDGRFARIDLDDTTLIQIKDKRAGNVEEDANYKRNVPHMSEVLKTFPAASREIANSLLVPDPQDIDRNRCAAVFDLPPGRLVAGEPEAMITRFKSDIEWEPRRLARWTDFYTSIKPPLTLQLISLASGGATREITFRETLRMLTIGNEPERLILGVMPTSHDNRHEHAHDVDAAPVQPTGHFILYYDLLENPPATRPVPIPTQITGSGCPNNNLP